MIKFFLILTSILFSSMSNSNYLCSGKVIHLGSDGRLAVSNGFGVHKLCLLTDDKCKFWASLLTTAKIADKSVSIYYSHPSIGGNQNHSACQNIGDWVIPSDTPYYVQLN